MSTGTTTTTSREFVLSPAMCGANSLFVGRLGDWTWNAVSDACGVDALTARNADGEPTYLAFQLFDVRGADPAGFTFGDRIDVRTAVFACGAESVATLHRVAPAGSAGAADPTLEPAEFFEDRRPDCLYALNFNRWVSRSAPGSNRGLVRASPPGFTTAHLPELPREHSPRLACAQARQHLTLRDAPTAGEPGFAGFTTDYRIDPTRDLNGVGLVYFAAYFSIVDGALLAAWRSAGRPDAAFLARRTRTRRLCYLSNVDADTVLSAEVSSSLTGSPGGLTDEVVDVVLRDRENGAVVAVACQELTWGAA
ncbi:LnmK family bifunctional acyltransferase/decarboxylase [Saccharothrix longispora]|uniref:LnmK family bifunctional acyltransferase/decarboxylase n=1 Tax=Saccharothrix longispora TaxID=33920 RepID=UPI0028FD5A4C|nr:LnmK family bifunctional acyltransferase/decarboxylase [Saccharothrix longispora]MDU0291032.1 biosynthesis cluster domain-containing protein [Saccharothrix longispora]